MNILFLSNKSAYTSKSFGGAESSFRLMAENLKKRGHKVIYVTKSRSSYLIPYVETIEVEGVLLKNLKTTRGYDLSPGIRKANNILIDSMLEKIVSKENVKIAYCFYERENLRTLLKIRKKNPMIRVVMRMAGMQWYEHSKKDQKVASEYEHLFNRLDGTNFISHDLERMVREKLDELDMQVRFKNSFVADIGSSKEPGRDIPYNSLPAPPYKIIMATRFTPYQKRQDILVKALAEMGSSPDVRLIMIGDGKRRPEMERLAGKLGVDRKIKFIPFMSQEELWKELQTAHLLCHATEYEGLGKVIIESMAIGLPVLVSDVRPLNTYIDAQNGFLVENQPTKWARKIREILLDDSSRKKVSGNSMEWIRQYYDPRKNVELYEKHFCKIIGNIE